MSRHSMLISGLVTAMMLVSAAPASAQLPPRPVRIVVPFTPGGFPDRIARLIAGEMSETHSQRVYVENKPGAGGMIGAVEVARAAPDGTTLLMSTMPTLVLAPLINPRPDFRPIEDLTHVAHIGGPPNAFVVATTSRVQSFADLLQIAKDTPLTYGTAGVGTVGHLTAVYVAQRASLKLTHVPYNGPMLGDIISGTVEIGSLTASTVMGQIAGGKLRALVVGTDKRLDFYSKVPTFKELGFDISPIAWMAIAGPAGMSGELQADLNKKVRDILATPKMKETLVKELIEPIELSPQEVRDFVQGEIGRWSPIVASVGLRK
jgi:tripartite-type tricarboxylate transporter receptor subunit TctC